MDFVEGTIANERGGIKKKYTSLQAMLMVITRAANIYGSDWNGFLSATSYVFMGVYQHGAGAMLAAHRSDFKGYFDGDSGFHSDFQDGSNQVRHFWAAFATAANPSGDNPNGQAIAEFGNYVHDVMADWVGQEGTTITDYKLSVTGIDIATQVGNQISTPIDLVSVLATRLGEDGPGYIGPEINVFPGWITPYK